MRLNLPRHNCVHFRVSGESTVSKGDDDGIELLMNQTETFSQDEDGKRIQFAFFGSRSRVAGINHLVRGRLIKSIGQDDICLISLSISSDRVLDHLSRPPATMRPVSALLDASASLFGRMEVTCNAVFEYDESEGYRSRARFPIPLVFEDKATEVTHIEQAQFSSRVNDKIGYRISVSEASSSVRHSVVFEDTVQLDRKSVSELLRQAGTISSKLIMCTGGEDNAPG